MKYLSDLLVYGSLQLKDQNGTYKININAPDLTADYTLTLPGNDGNTSQVLTTNGSGTLSWSDVSYTNLSNKPSTFPPSSHTHAWSDITSTPTTLAGYGIANGVSTSRQIIAGTGLGGGGNLSANRTLSLDIPGLTADSSPDGAADYVAVYDASAAVHKKVLLNNLPGGGGGASALDDLSDVSIGTPDSNTIMRYDGGASLWQSDSCIKDDGSNVAVGNATPSTDYRAWVAGEFRFDPTEDTTTTSGGYSFNRWAKIFVNGVGYWTPLYT